MIITKWLKKYNTKLYRFVTYDDGTQCLIVDNGDVLFPINVLTASEASCFGQSYKVNLTDCIKIKEKKISLIKAKRIAKRNDLFKKYKLFVEKVKEVEEKTGVSY